MVSVFSADPLGSALELLASAVFLATPSETPRSRVASGPASGHVSLSVPYNPIATVPAKLAKEVLELEFVEMAKITLD